GWMPEEFALTGGVMSGRGARTDEYIDVLRRLWAGEVDGFDGKHYTVPAGWAAPGPVQRPRPPVPPGGLVPPALVRAGRPAAGGGGGWRGGGGDGGGGIGPGGGRGSRWSGRRPSRRAGTRHRSGSCAGAWSAGARR